MKQLFKKNARCRMYSSAFALGLSAMLLSPMDVMAGNDAIANQTSVAQVKTVKGHVVDENGEPMIGVTVKIVDNNTGGAITDFDGNFTLSLPAGSQQISLAYVGYKTKVLKVTGSTVEVALEPDTQGLDEVVVIGFGTVKKRDVTGAVSQVKSDVILQTPTSSVATALQGRITGLDVNGSELRIRGNRSINGNNAPLVIIDGVQGGSMGDLNPDDIETIDVLKDASSTAIYGSQGANGVIIITTKKAQAGKMSVSYNGYVTGAFREEHPDYRSGQNYYEARRLSAANAGQWNSTADDLNLFGSPTAYAAYKANAWTDYDKELQKGTTWSNRHTITLSGGNEKTTARVSLG